MDNFWFSSLHVCFIAGIQTSVYRSQNCFWHWSAIDCHPFLFYRWFIKAQRSYPKKEFSDKENGKPDQSNRKRSDFSLEEVKKPVTGPDTSFIVDLWLIDWGLILQMQVGLLWKKYSWSQPQSQQIWCKCGEGIVTHQLLTMNGTVKMKASTKKNGHNCWIGKVVRLTEDKLVISMIR